MTAPGPGRRRKRSSGHHYDGGDDDDNDDNGDAGDNNDDGTGANNGGGSALDSSYQASQNASGVGQGQVSDHSFGSTYGNFNGFSGGATSQAHGNVQRAPSLRSTDKVKAPIDHTQEIVHGMAALAVSVAKIRSSSDACAPASSYAPSPTNSKKHPCVKSLAAAVTTRTVTVPSHKEKLQIGKPHTKYSSIYGKGATVPSHKEKRQIDKPQTKYSSTFGSSILRWLHENPCDSPWVRNDKPQTKYSSTFRPSMSRWLHENPCDSPWVRNDKPQTKYSSTFGPSLSRWLDEDTRNSPWSPVTMFKPNNESPI